MYIIYKIFQQGPFKTLDALIHPTFTKDTWQFQWEHVDISPGIRTLAVRWKFFSGQFVSEIRKFIEEWDLFIEMDGKESLINHGNLYVTYWLHIYIYNPNNQAHVYCFNWDVWIKLTVTSSFSTH